MTHHALELRRHRTIEHDITEGEAPSTRENAAHFVERARHVGKRAECALAHDDIERRRIEGQGLRVAANERCAGGVAQVGGARNVVSRVIDAHDTTAMRLAQHAGALAGSRSHVENPGVPPDHSQVGEASGELGPSRVKAHAQKEAGDRQLVQPRTAPFERFRLEGEGCHRLAPTRNVVSGPPTDRPSRNGASRSCSSSSR